MDFGIGDRRVAAGIAEDDFALSLAIILWGRGIHTLYSSRMIWCKVGKVIDDAIDDYPEILEAVMLGDLFHRDSDSHCKGRIKTYTLSLQRHIRTTTRVLEQRGAGSDMADCIQLYSVRT